MGKYLYYLQDKILKLLKTISIAITFSGNCQLGFAVILARLRFEVAASIGMTRRLKGNAVPTIYVAGISEASTSNENISDRKRRQVFP